MSKKSGVYALDLGESEAGAQLKVSKISDAESASSDGSGKEFPEAFAGMGKEMVLHYSNTPGWNRARKVLLLIFWVSWVVLLGSVIYLTVTHERCSLSPSLKWWEKTSVYHIFPESFMDSNGDGAGDLNGIKNKLDYIKDINMDAVWVSTFYDSPMVDYGYDVSDHKEVHPQYGSLSVFDQLLAEIHDQGLKLIIDFIPNHTSDKHVWFERSVARESPYDDFYIWKDCGTEANQSLPNNWLCVSGATAWTYHPIRKQCYYHQYGESIPDLNMRNEAVRAELDEVLRYWLDKGVDGFHVDSADRLYEDLNLADEVVIDASKPNDYDSLNHNMTRNLPEVLDMINRWRGILDSYTDSDRILMTDTNTSPSGLKGYYGRTHGGGSHLPFNYQLVKVNNKTSGFALQQLVNQSLGSLPENATVNWLLWEESTSRPGSRVGLDKLDSLHMLLLLLPGVSTSHYGDEIGMLDTQATGSQSRELSRSTMQWTPSVSECSGFTSNSSCVVNPSAAEYNVETEMDDLSSHLNLFKNLSKLRTENSFVYGEWKEHVVTENIYSFLRLFDGQDTYLVAMNVGVNTEEVDMSKQVSDDVSAVSVKALAGGLSVFSVGDKVDLSSISLSPGQGAVFSWPYTIKQLI